MYFCSVLKLFFAFCYLLFNNPNTLRQRKHSPAAPLPVCPSRTAPAVRQKKSTSLKKSTTLRNFIKFHFSTNPGCLGPSPRPFSGSIDCLDHGKETAFDSVAIFVTNLAFFQPLRLDIKRRLTARSDRVKCCDLHPTEPWMLASLYNGNVHVWNHENQTLVKSFEVCDLPVRAAKFVPRKNWVVTGSDDMQVRQEILQRLVIL